MITSVFGAELSQAWPSSVPTHADYGSTYIECNIWDAIEKGVAPSDIYAMAQAGAPLVYRRLPMLEGTFNVMHIAVELKDLAAVDALLHFDPRLANNVDYRGWTPVDYAQKLKDNFLMQHLFNLNQELMSDNTSEARFREIIEAGRRGGISNDFYLAISIFHRAALYGKKALIKVLLEVNPLLAVVADFNGFTAYHYALSQNKDEIMTMLPQYVPNLTKEERLAHENFMKDIAEDNVRQVAEKIAKVKHVEFARSTAGYDPVQLAIASFVSADMIKLLLSHNLCKKGPEIYFFAVYNNNLKALKTIRSLDKAFHQHGASTNQFGCTPAQLAHNLGRDYEEIAAYLDKEMARPEETSFIDSLIATFLK